MEYQLGYFIFFLNDQDLSESHSAFHLKEVYFALNHSLYAGHFKQLLWQLPGI